MVLLNTSSSSELATTGSPWTSRRTGFRKEAKKLLRPWIIKTYSEDKYLQPPPITISRKLLGYKDAVQFGRLALKYLHAGEEVPNEAEEPLQIYLPLCLDQKGPQSYKVIKASAFVYRTPEQRQKIEKSMEKFKKMYGCGLELLSLRRSHGGRKQGSIEDILKTIYRYIRLNGENLTKELNLTRSFAALDQIRKTHFEALQRKKVKLRRRLIRAIDAQIWSPRRC